MTRSNDVPNSRTGGGLTTDDVLIQQRLQKAWQSIQAPAPLVGRIQAAVSLPPASAPPAQRRLRVLPFPRRAYRMGLPVAAAAAVLLLVATVIPFGPPAKADQKLLREIHEANLSASTADFHASADPNVVQGQLARRLSRDVRLPQGPDVTVCGWAAPRFRDQVVGTYLVEVQGRPISVIVIRGNADDLAFNHKADRGGRVFYWCGFAECRMAAVQVDDLVYISVGEKSGFTHEALVQFLQTKLLDPQ